MSHDDALRRQTQEQIRNNPGLQKVEPHQTGSAHDAGVINAEVERLRQERERNSGS